MASFYALSVCSWSCSPFPFKLHDNSVHSHRFKVKMVEFRQTDLEQPPEPSEYGSCDFSSELDVLWSVAS